VDGSSEGLRGIEARGWDGRVAGRGVRRGREGIGLNRECRAGKGYMAGSGAWAMEECNKKCRKE